MTIFNPIKSSSITNPIYLSLPKEVELHIASFLSHQDQVVLSGVNQSAYQRLSNKGYFKDLFKKKYYFEKKNTPLARKIKHLCTDHPKNCWKVACCFFQTGQINFNQSFLDETRIQLKARLLAKKERNERRLEKICGSNSDDPDSPIHYALLIYQQFSYLIPEKEELEKEAVGVFSQLTKAQLQEFEKINGSSSPDDFISVLKKLNHISEINHFLVFLEQHKEDIKALEKYEQLNEKKTRLENLIKRIADHLQRIENKDYPIYIDNIVNFRKLLENYLCCLLMSTDLKKDDIYAAFKVYLNTYKNFKVDVHHYLDFFEFPKFNILSIYSKLLKILQKKEIQLEKNYQFSLNFQAACKNNLLLDVIDIFVSDSVDKLSLKACDSFLDTMVNFALFKVSREEIEKMLIDAIQKKHGVLLKG